MPHEPKLPLDMEIALRSKVGRDPIAIGWSSLEGPCLVVGDYDESAKSGMVSYGRPVADVLDAQQEGEKAWDKHGCNWMLAPILC